MDNILEILNQTPLFNGLNEDELRQVRPIIVDKFYNKGKTIFTEGDEATGFYQPCEHGRQAENDGLARYTF